jgi:hypothetical protein
MPDTGRKQPPRDDPSSQSPRRPDPDDVAMIEEIQALQGEEMPVDQDALLDPSEFESRRTPTLTELDRGEASPDFETTEGQEATLDGLALDELRDGETDDPAVATEEGLTYVPPSDPPVRADPDDPEGADVAAGAAVSALSDPYDADHGSELLPNELDLTARIRDALQADSATSGYADRLAIGTRGSTAVVRGVVDDVDDSDTIVAVIERVDGIEEVVDETELADG